MTSPHDSSQRPSAHPGQADAEPPAGPSLLADPVPEGWSTLGAPLRAVFDTGDFATGLTFVAAIGEAAEAADHHPDVLLTYPRVTVTLISHDVGAVTARDLALAERINEIAAGLGISAR